MVLRLSVGNKRTMLVQWKWSEKHEQVKPVSFPKASKFFPSVETQGSNKKIATDTMKYVYVKKDSWNGVCQLGSQCKGWLTLNENSGKENSFSTK